MNLAIIKEEKEEDIKDKSKLLDRDKIINSYEEIYKPKEPIAIEELIEKSSKFNSSKALIYGKAGIGKTTFCKYIAYRWAKGELYSEFENIVYIALREWKDDGLESIIKKIYFEEKHKNEAIEIDQDKTLFLFDGYDELSDTSFLHGAIKKYNLQNYIITSRPYGYRKSDFDVNEVFETIGFTDENVTAYIDKFFEEQSHKTNLQNFLKQNINIKHIAYIPLMLEMICWLWQEKIELNQTFSSNTTMTELYTYIIENMMKKHEAKKKKHEVSSPYNRDYIRNYLGKLAFKGLIKQKLDFNYDFFKNISINFNTIRDEMIFVEKNVIPSGFLKSNNKEIELLDNNFEFPHLTFQEYFSALYVSNLSRKKQRKIIEKYKFYPYMQVFFIFLGGLIKDKSLFFNEIENKPKDIVGFYSFILTISSLSEINPKNLDKKFKEEIIEKLNNWINISLKNEKNFKLLLKKIPVISSFIDNQIINNLIKIITHKHMHIDRIEVVTETITSLGRNDNILLNTLLKIILDNSIDSLVRICVVKSLTNLGRCDNYFVDSLITIMKDENIYASVRKAVSKPLIATGKSDDKIISVLTEYLKDKSTINHQEDVAKALISLDRRDDNFVFTLLEIIKDENVFYPPKCIIIKSLVNLARNDRDFISILIKVVTNKNLDYRERQCMKDVLINLGKSDDKFFYTLIELIRNESINYSLKEKTLNRSDNNTIQVLLEIIKDESVYFSLREITGIFLVNLGRKDDYFLEVLIKSFNEDAIYERSGMPSEIGESLMNLDRNDNKFIDMLFKIIKSNTSVSFGVAYHLEKFSRSNNYFINLSIKTIKNENIDKYNRELVAKALTKLARSDDFVLDFLIEIIKDDNIHYLLRIKIAELLTNLDRDDDKIIDFLIETIKEYKDIQHVFFKQEKIVQFLINSARSDDKIIDIIIEFLKNKYVDSNIRKNTAESLRNINRNDNYFFDSLIQIIKDENISVYIREKIVNSLIYLARNNNRIIDKLFEILNNRNTNFIIEEKIVETFAEISSTNSRILEKIDFKKYSELLLKRCTIKALFDAYGINGINQKILENKALYDGLPFYVENHVMYTIFESKEIKIKRL